MNERLDKESDWEDRVAMRLPDVSETEVQKPVRTDCAQQPKAKSEMTSFAFQIAFYGLIGIGLAEVSYFWKTIWPARPQSSQEVASDRNPSSGPVSPQVAEQNETMPTHLAKSQPNGNPSDGVEKPLTGIEPIQVASDPAIADSFRQTLQQMDNERRSEKGLSPRAKENSTSKIR